MKRLILGALLLSSSAVLAQDKDSLIGTAVKINKYEGVDNVAARSLIINFDSKGQVGIVFDMDTLRMTGSWLNNAMKYNGLPFTGAHGPFPSLNKKPLFFTKPGPGWSLTDSFDDPREGDKPKLGRLPDSHGKYLGSYRKGDLVLLSYKVGETKVLDLPTFKDGVISRTLQLSGNGKLTMQVGVGEVKVDGQAALIDECAVKVQSGVLSSKDGQLYWTLDLKGTLKTGISYSAGKSSADAKTPNLYAEDLSTLTSGGDKRWPETFKVESTLSSKKNAYVIDRVGVPYGNKYEKKMRISAMDFFSDGTTAAVCTWDGGVWIVKNIDAKLENVIWQKFASGLHEPMGLKIVDDVIYTVADDQITRFHDLNKDGEADFYECFNNDWDLTSGFHAFCFDLQTDKAGNFYFAFGSPVKPGGRSFQRLGRHHGAILKVSKDGSKLESYATGFRAPNGIGVGPDGQVTSGDNEGTYVPRSPLNWIAEGGFGGVVDTYENLDKLKSTATTSQRAGDRKKFLETSEMPKPLAWLPKHVDNSGGGQVWVTSDKWGPFKNELLHLSYGQSALYLVMKEMKNDQIQGGLVKIPVQFSSSAMRARFNQKDGQLYVVGLKGWQTNAAKDGGLDRVRFTGKNPNMPVKMKTTAKGVELTFTTKLDAELANDPSSFSLKGADIWWSHNYGSKEFFLGQRDVPIEKKKQGWSSLKVKSSKLQKDGKTVFIEIEDMKLAHELELSYDLESTDGEAVIQKIYMTVHEL